MTLSSAREFIAFNIDFQNYIININNNSCKHLYVPKFEIKNTDTVQDIQSNLVCDDSHTVLIRYCSALSPCGKWYASISAKKKLLLWETEQWSLISERSIERGASKLIFTPRSDSIILTDKTGDVYLYSVENPDKNKTFLLGHVSVLLDVLITPDERFIITCDRDEKIRVSKYPNSYNIKSFCLGHTEFVIKITMLNNTLLSASGDGTFRFWNYIDGKELTTYSISYDIKHSVAYKDNEIEEQNYIAKYAINDMSSVYQNGDSSYFCIYVNSLPNVFVYKVIDADLSVTCIQNINLPSEPISILLNNTGVLWILLSTGIDKLIPFVKVMVWDNETFKTAVDNKIVNSVKSLNELFKKEKFSNIRNTLSGLYKNPKLNNINFKRLKQ